MILALFLRPVLQLICCITSAASELRLTVPAHQAGLLSSLHGEQHVLVELEAAELLQALFALVLVVLAGRVPSRLGARLAGKRVLRYGDLRWELLGGALRVAPQLDQVST